MPPLAAAAAAPQEEAAALGKSSFAFAFYMDRQKEERERGVTISCTTKEFFTDRYHYTIIEAPGEQSAGGGGQDGAAVGGGGGGGGGGAHRQWPCWRCAPGAAMPPAAIVLCACAQPSYHADKIPANMLPVLPALGTSAFLRPPLLLPRAPRMHPSLLLPVGLPPTSPAPAPLWPAPPQATGISSRT